LRKKGRKIGFGCSKAGSFTNRLPPRLVEKRKRRERNMFTEKISVCEPIGGSAKKETLGGGKYLRGEFQMGSDK